MEEGRSQEHAYVTQITGVELARTEIKLTISSLPADSTILNDALWKLRTDLDIDQFEFNRNHCAIKERDLFQILGANGHSFDPSVVSRFKEMPLPAPSRSALISARDCISKWSHTDIDDFLLEAGISGLAAGRDVGGRQNRAIAILKFAIENPSATTAENSLFSVFLVRRTKSQLVDAQSRDATITDKVTIESPRRNEDRESSGRSPNRVFVVHGQNERARSAVVSFLTKVGLQGIVLHEQPNMGRHLLTKFIEEAELTTFAIVLMTDDDVGGLKGDALLPRARQNVILELGYFLSHFGQRKVCALITPGLETPSDFDGIVYISMEGGGKWEAELRRELEAAGMPLIDVV
jgi:predicted nucleotide-binding protein